MIGKTRVEIEMDHSRGNGNIPAILRENLWVFAKELKDALFSPDASAYELHWMACPDSTFPETLNTTVMLLEIGAETVSPHGRLIASSLIRASLDSILVRKSDVRVPIRNEPSAYMSLHEGVATVAKRLHEDATAREATRFLARR